MVWLISFIIMMVVGCYFTYKSAEAHELHKMRAAFEDKRKKINQIIKEHYHDNSFKIEFYEGEIEEIDEMEDIIDEQLELLRYFDVFD